MGWNFFRENGGKRAGQGGPAFAFDLEEQDSADEGLEITDLRFETEARGIPWRPLTARDGKTLRDWERRPVRFIDGKDVGRTVAWLRSPEGYPIAVRLGQIGAISMRNDGGKLVREWFTAERVVAMYTQAFGWEEIENLTRALQQEGFRLLPTGVPQKENIDFLTFECEPWRKTSQNATLTEMTRLEKQAIASGKDTSGSLSPTLVDGRLEPRLGSFALTDPVVGLIKTYAQPYLQTRAQWEALYDLAPGERTPSFLAGEDEPGRKLRVVSFYVRLCDGLGSESLDSGIVRVELSTVCFENTFGSDWTVLDGLAGLLVDYRCHDATYGRAAISIEPIVRAEESLGALFTEADALISKFYNRTLL